MIGKVRFIFRGEENANYIFKYGNSFFSLITGEEYELEESRLMNVPFDLLEVLEYNSPLTGGVGATGPKGDQGEQGVQGPKGDKGDTGLQGPQGLKGDTGLQGPKGDQGLKGDTGTAGAQGIQGVKGDPGTQGIQGLKGDKGDLGTQGTQGPKGDPGFITELQYNDIIARLVALETPAP